MGNPFQDQLLKAGLVSKKQVKKAKHEKRVSRSQNKGKPSAPQTNKAQEEKAAQAKRNKKINQQRAAEKEKKERLAQVKQLIVDNRQERDERGDAYNFVEENKIKRIFVSDDMAEQLSRGQLAIVKSGSSYEVVTAKVARQIAERHQQTIIVLHDNEKD